MTIPAPLFPILSDVHPQAQAGDLFRVVKENGRHAHHELARGSIVQLLLTDYFGSDTWPLFVVVMGAPVNNNLVGQSIIGNDVTGVFVGIEPHAVVPLEQEPT